MVLVDLVDSAVGSAVLIPAMVVGCFDFGWPSFIYLMDFSVIDAFRDAGDEDRQHEDNVEAAFAPFLSTSSRTSPRFRVSASTRSVVTATLV